VRPAEFGVEITELGGGVRVATLRGELDISTADDLVDQLIMVPDAVVVVDLSALGFIDSTGISALVQADKRLNPSGGRVVLTRPTPNILRLLDIVGLADWVSEWDDGWDY
jgi:anti-anti-sigma factor